MRTLGVVQLQSAGEGVEHAVRGAGKVAALQARVVRDAHPRRDGSLLAPQFGHAAGAVVGQAEHRSATRVCAAACRVQDAGALPVAPLVVADGARPVGVRATSFLRISATFWPS